MSLSEQIRLLRGPKLLEEPKYHTSVNANEWSLVQAKQLYCPLHRDQHLDRLVCLFMEQSNFLWPVIGCRFKDRLDNLLVEYRHEYGRGITLPMDRPDLLSFSAFVCMVLACMELIEFDTVASTASSIDETQNRGQNWYSEYQQIIESFDETQFVTIDTIRSRLVEVLYLCMCDRRKEVYPALVQTVGLAFIGNLNDESKWTACSQEEVLSRRVLWWTLYLMDRQLGHRYGKPYLIRESEFAVDDFKSHVSNPVSQLPFENTFSPVEIRQNCWYKYLQFMTHWSRLFTRLWDALFSVQAGLIVNDEELEIIDDLILNLNRTNGVGTGQDDNILYDLMKSPVLMKDNETSLQLRLTIFTASTSEIQVSFRI